jgi:putative ABC transport system permease protein
VANYVCVVTAYRGLKGSRDEYYRQYRMPDLFASCKKAPVSVAEELARVPGVRKLRDRIVFEVTIDLPEVPSPCGGRVLSLPDAREPVVGDVHLTRGRWFEGDGDRQVVVGDRFASEHGLEVGDRLAVIMNNRKESLRIVGTAIAPEFVYLLRGSDIIPDPVHFTVLWMSRSFTESVFDYQDSFNDVVALLERDAVRQDVLAAFDGILGRYGGFPAYERKDQASHFFLDGEIEGLRGTATFIPGVFLGVAAFVLHVLMGRLVRAQRTQLSVLRAFGYATRSLVLHVVSFTLVVGGIGTVLGVSVGAYLARGLVGAYQAFYSFPVLRFEVDPLVAVTAVGISLGFSVLGAVSAARHVARLRPAEGMRPEAPRTFRRTWIEAWSGVWRRIGFVWRMVVRGVARARLRTAMTVLGVALAASILFLSYFTKDSIHVLLEFQYGRVDRQDVIVTFNDYRGREALHEMRRLPGVISAEPELAVPVTLRSGWREKRSAVQGIDGASTLHGLVDRYRGEVELPSSGLLLSAELAERLRLEVGDPVEVEVLDGKKPRFTVTVAALVDEYIGTAAYVGRDRLSRWIGEEDALTGVRLRIDAAEADRLDRDLKRLPAVESAVFRSQSRENFEDTLAESMGIMTAVLTLFAGIISFGVIYNAARISLEVRRRELASLRVIGFTNREVASVLTREGLLVSMVAIPVGIGLGWLFCWAMARVYDTELYRWPLVIREESLFLTALWVLAFTVAAGLLVARRVRRLDLVEVLKARE